MKKLLLVLAFGLYFSLRGTAQIIENETVTVSAMSVIDFKAKAEKEKKNPIHKAIKTKKPKPKFFIGDFPMPKAGKGVELKAFEEKPSATFKSETTSPAPANGFTAIVDVNYSIPPDVAGAVGPNHVVTTLNGIMRIQNRTGTTISTLDPDNFWSSVRETGDVYDPKIVYDPIAQRFIFVDLDGAFSSSSNILLGVSQTSDPTGAWNLYRIKTNSDNTSLWMDFPSIGFNKDWIVVSGNMFTTSGSFSKVKVFSIKKSDTMTGVVSPSVTAFSVTDGGFTISPATVMDNTTDFVPLMCVWNRSQGSYRLYKITGTSTPVLEARNYPSLGAANAWFSYTYYDNQAPQKDMTSAYNGLDDGDDRMRNLVYRNGKIWATHSPFFSSTGNFDASAVYRCAVRWMQLDSAGVISQTGKIEDTNLTNMGSYQVPTNSYAYPSIAVNASNDAMIGFSHFSPTIYGSSSYVTRYNTDPANTMQSVYISKPGVGKYYKTYGGSRNRWGDYTSTMVDPLNDIAFWTVGEYAEARDNTSGYDTWATYWTFVSPCSESNAGTVAGSTTACSFSNSGTLTLSGHSGSILRWESSTDNFTTTTAIANTTTTLNYLNLSVTTKYRAVVQTVGCPTPYNSAQATVTINNISVAGTVGGSVDVCAGNNSGTLTLTGHTGDVVRWESSTDNFATITQIANTTNTQTFTNLNLETKFRAVVKNGTCDASFSAPAIITVGSVTAGGTLTTGGSFCDIPNSGTITLTGNSGSVIRWESSTNNFANVITIANTTNTLEFTNLITTTKFRAVSQLGACVAGNSTPSTVYVINTPEPDGVTTSQSICYNTSTTLVAGCAIGTVKWYLANGSTVAYTGSPFVTPNLPSSTTYKVRCEVNGSLSCKSIFIDVPVNVNPIISPPTEALSSSNSICQGTSVTLTATCAVGTVKWYNSSTATTAIGTGSPLVVTPNATTTYYPTCFSNNCEGARINGAGEINSTLTLSDPMFDRSGGTNYNYHYKTHTFSLNSSRNIIISLGTADGGSVTPIYSDTYLYLYGPGGFNPSSPLTNRIAYDDDSGGNGASRIVANLNAGEYTIVMTSYSSGNPGLPWTYKMVVLGLPPLNTTVTVTPNTVTIPTVVAGQTVIAGNTASLDATCAVGNPNWYTFNESTLLFEGSPFVTPTVTENTIYKVRCKNIVCNSAFVEVAITATNLVYSIKTGDWEDPTTWNTGVVPTSNDNVIIDLTHVVTINNDQARAKHVEFRTDAHLNFANEQAKLNLGL